MLLYHATNATKLESILREGIRPRGDEASQWKKHPSRPDRVYLTTLYGLYFAAAAVREDAHSAVVFEIDGVDMDDDRFSPDEDAIVQSMVCAGIITNEEMPTVAQRIHLPTNDEGWWRTSLTMLGTASYVGAIPVEAITRYAVINFTQALYDLALVPTITIDYTQLHARELQLLARAVFDVPRLSDRPDPLSQFRDRITVTRLRNAYHESDPFLCDCPLPFAMEDCIDASHVGISVQEVIACGELLGTLTSP